MLVGLISRSLSPWFVDSRLLPPGAPRGFPTVCVCVLITCDKDTSPTGVGVAQMTSLYLNDLSSNPISSTKVKVKVKLLSRIRLFATHGL